MARRARAGRARCRRRRGSSGCSVGRPSRRSPAVVHRDAEPWHPDRFFGHRTLPAPAIATRALDHRPDRAPDDPLAERRSRPGSCAFERAATRAVGPESGMAALRIRPHVLRDRPSDEDREATSVARTRTGPTEAPRLRNERDARFGRRQPRRLDPADAPARDAGGGRAPPRPRPAPPEAIAASSPPEVWGSWARATSSAGDGRVERQRRRHEAPVVAAAAGLDAGPGEVQRPVERGQGRGREDESACPMPGPSPGRGRAGRSPVTSVAARTPCATRTSAAARLRRRIPSTAASNAASVAAGWPCRRPLHEQAGAQRLGQEQHVARLAPRPCAGAGRDGRPRSRPARTSAPRRGSCGRRPSVPPASRTLALAPARISVMRRCGSSSGNAAIDRAKRTRPPIANTSDRALAAAISPKVRGSSTSGGKKSSVPMIARSGATR